MDQYILKARIYPAVITALPFIVLSSVIVDNEFSKLFENSGYLKIAPGVTLPVVLIYLLSQINRLIGKEVFEKAYFKDEEEMPTTNYMLLKDAYLSAEYKSLIRQKLIAEAGFSWPSLDEETKDLMSAKKRISEAVALIRNNVGTGRLLLQHNIEYGFVRNLIGGSPIALICSIVNAFIFVFAYSSPVGFWVSVVMALFFLSCLALSKLLIDRLGQMYAKRLFQEYVG